MGLQRRISNPKKIDKLLIKSELEKGKEVIVQFSTEIYTDVILEELNDMSLMFDENFIIRFFGHYQNSFDCEILSKIPNVKSLLLDCLFKVDNLIALTKLKNLKCLALDIFELKEKEILKAPNFKNLIELRIGKTKTKAFDLKYIKEIKNLKRLSINGHTKNINVIGSLNKLESLGLTSISKIPLTFINDIKNLKSLHILLGGRENLDEIEHNQIESLGIIRVRGFKDLNNISKFKNLKSLWIQDQIQLEELNFDEELPQLNKFKLINCKKMTSITGIEKLININQVRIYNTSIKFDEFIKIKFPESLKILAFYTSRMKADEKIKERLLSLGFKEKL